MFKENEIKIEVTKGSGPGGQHKNKVETCAKIIHIKTGLTETCQETRSKLKNIELAKKRLYEKIQKNIDLNKKLKQNKLRKNQINTGERTFRRRTYNYKTGVVKDHITGKTAPLQKVLDGNIELLR